MAAKIVTLPHGEYRRLREIEARFEAMRKLAEFEFFASPPTKDVKKIIREFRKTGLYREAFLGSLERGLRESLYFRKLPTRP